MAAPLAPEPSSPSPAGTVTLLFTDIEGSTRLWEERSAAMRLAVSRHDALMRHAVESRRGRIFKTAGDAFCVAFAAADDAVAAALEAQRALAREPWPDALPLRVRMALYSGAVESRDGDYFGPALNRVARLLSAGHGGQTLLAESARQLSRDALPPLASLASLGEHTLRDVTLPETIYQLCHPDLPREFPPLREATATGGAPPPASPPTTATAAAPEPCSVAVLPFTNLSGEAENEYFSDGLSEELLNVLAKIRGLRVSSRTSAFSFKGAATDLPTIAMKLKVANVLEGSVRKSGKRIRVTAQLIEVATDSHLWSETYDRELDDVFAVQDDIAQSVVRELRTHLLGSKPAVAAAEAKTDVERASLGRSTNPEGHRLLLQARFHAERLSRESVERAIDLLKQALALEPDFALAWAELSLTYGFLLGFNNDGPVTRRHMKEAAERAVALSPHLPEARVALARYLSHWEWNLKAAEEQLRVAREVAPDSPRVLSMGALVALRREDGHAALAFAQRAAELDPLSPLTLRQLARVCLYLGRHDEAERAAREAIALNPGVGVVHWALGSIALETGRPAEALAAAGKEPVKAYRLHLLGMAHHTLGNDEASRAALAELIALDTETRTCADQIAKVHAWRGEVDEAFAWLDRAIGNHDPGISFVRVSTLRRLKGDPRWQKVVSHVIFD